MERHLSHYSEGNETSESNGIFDILEIKEEAIDIEINEKSNPSLCSNDNSIPYCNILLSKFLDLTPENDSTSDQNYVDTRIEAKKSEINAATQNISRERKEKKQNDLHNFTEQTRILDSCKEIRKIKENYLQKENEEVDIETVIKKRQRKTEKQRLNRARKKLEKSELSLAKKRKSTAEASKRYRERQKMKEVDIEVEINKRKKNAERYRRYRKMQKLKKDNLQDENDIEIENERRKKKAERQKRYMERKKLENNELYWVNQRKRMAEAMRRYRLKKKKINEFQDGNEQIDIEVAK